MYYTLVICVSIIVSAVLLLLIANPYKNKPKQDTITNNPIVKEKSNEIIEWDKRTVLYKELGDDSRPVRTKSNSNFQIYVRRNDIISNAISSIGTWYDCIALMRSWDSLPGKQSNDYFLDIGANIGICSMNFIDKGVKTISIEPLPGNLNLYTKSLLLNPQMLDKVTLFPVGVGEKETTSVMKVLPGNWGGASLLKDLKGFVNYTVNISTLDKVMAKFTGKIHLACLDVEGYEYNVLLGATETLKRKIVRHYFMELRCEYIRMVGKKEDDFYNFFEKYGYHMNKRYCKSPTEEFNIVITEN